MKCQCLRLVAAASCALAGVPAARADLLAGSVSYNPGNGLYTYSYTWNGQGGAALNIDLLMGAGGGATPHLVSVTSPSGWQFGGSDLAENGWHSGWSVISTSDTAALAGQKGVLVSGFSFTTAAAPRELTAGALDYSATFVPWSDARFAPPGQAGTNVIGVDSGQVVVPDFGVTIASADPAPEPSAIVLGVIGSLAFACRKRRQSYFPTITT